MTLEMGHVNSPLRSERKTRSRSADALGKGMRRGQRPSQRQFGDPAASTADGRLDVPLPGHVATASPKVKSREATIQVASLQFFRRKTSAISPSLPPPPPQRIELLHKGKNQKTDGCNRQANLNFSKGGAAAGEHSSIGRRLRSRQRSRDIVCSRLCARDLQTGRPQTG